MRVICLLFAAFLLAGCFATPLSRSDGDNSATRSEAFAGDDWDSDVEQPGIFTGKSGVFTIRVEDGELKVGDKE